LENGKTQLYLWGSGKMSLFQKKKKKKKVECPFKTINTTKT